MTGEGGAASFDPEQMLDGHDISYGDVTNGGNCQNGSPAVKVPIAIIYKLGVDDDHTPMNRAELEEFGPRLPDQFTKMELVDVEIGCHNYQSLVAGGVDVDSCTSCPLLKVSRQTSRQ